MSPETKQKLQLALALAIIVAAVRTGYILYTRHQEAVESQKPQSTAAAPLNPDYYVTPKKLYPHDLKSARELTRQPVWVKEGFRYTYYNYDAASRRADLAHEAGLLRPLEKLDIKDVITAPTPGAAGQQQLLAVFDSGGKTRAVPIGSVANGNYQIYSDEMFYVQDPHELYRHWPADVWDAIENHQVKPGMNELQVDFAIGMGTPQGSSDSDVKTVDYPNGNRPVKITYVHGKADKIAWGPEAH